MNVRISPHVHEPKDRHASASTFVQIAKEEAKNDLTKSVVNAMTVDVEDYFHVRAFANVLPPDQWDSLPSRVEANADRMLELFARRNVTATFFVLGWVAE